MNVRISMLAAGLLAFATAARAQTGGTPTVLPRPDFRFPGNVGRTYRESDPAQFPQPVQAPKGAPNIVLILIDDAGFGQFSTFGGGVPSPTMDRLAAEGLRYNRFHTTALCSPTRAALLTGRNHHSADVADHAIASMRNVKSIAPDRPFFLYVAPAATHAPHQVPADWIAKFKGKFD